MSRRIGFIGIIVHHRYKNAETVNTLLSQYGEIILSRTGLPRVREETNVITLVVEASTDEIGEITGKLGQIEGVTVKSALAKE